MRIFSLIPLCTFVTADIAAPNLAADLTAASASWGSRDNTFERKAKTVRSFLDSESAADLSSTTFTLGDLLGGLFATRGEATIPTKLRATNVWDKTAKHTEKAAKGTGTVLRETGRGAAKGMDKVTSFWWRSSNVDDLVRDAEKNAKDLKKKVENAKISKDIKKELRTALDLYEASWWDGIVTHLFSNDCFHKNTMNDRKGLLAELVEASWFGARSPSQRLLDDQRKAVKTLQDKISTLTDSKARDSAEKQLTKLRRELSRLEAKAESEAKHVISRRLQAETTEEEMEADDEEESTTVEELNDIDSFLPADIIVTDDVDALADDIEFQGVQDVAEHAKENVKTAAEKVKEGSEKAVEKVKEKMSDAKEKAEETGEDVKEKAEDTADKAKDESENVKEKAEDAEDKVEDKADETKGKAKEKAGDVKDAAADESEDVKDKAKEAEKKGEDIKEDAEKKQE